MTDTVWKLPRTVDQDASGNINPGKVYRFVNIVKIKTDDDDYCDISPWNSTGIDSKHKSPFLYAYNFNFNLPSNATVTKISCYIRAQQITKPAKRYDRRGNYSKSISKFCSVKLKTGSSIIGGGTGNDFSTKSGTQMLPYKKWSTESETVFSGTPAEWGLTAKDIVSIINSNNFGIVFQFVGTVSKGWVSPAVAYVKMKISYNTPSLSSTASNSNTPLKSEFLKIYPTYHDVEIPFTNNSSGVIGNIVYDDFEHPLEIVFKFHHKGASGETPIIIFESSSLIMGANSESYVNKKTSVGKYTMNPLHCGSDTNKVYTRTLAIFPGVLLGEQKITYVLNKVKYTLKVNIVSNTLTEEEKAQFIDLNQRCVIKNCLFYNNHARGFGGANCITTEYYLGDGNRFGRDSNVNIADNRYDENGGNSCPDTCWLGECKSSSDGG